LWYGFEEVNTEGGGGNVERQMGSTQKMPNETGESVEKKGKPNWKQEKKMVESRGEGGKGKRGGENTRMWGTGTPNPGIGGGKKQRICGADHYGRGGKEMGYPKNKKKKKGGRKT